MDQKEAIPDFQPQVEMREHLKDLVQLGSIEPILAHYRLVAPGLFYLRIPGAAVPLQQYAEEMKDSSKLPISIETALPVVSHFPGQPSPWDRRLLALSPEGWDEFAEWVLNLSFANRAADLVVWPDFDVIEINDPFATGPAINRPRLYRISAIILRSNKGAWRFDGKGTPKAIFKAQDAGNYRMGKMNDKIKE